MSPLLPFHCKRKARLGHGQVKKVLQPKPGLKAYQAGANADHSAAMVSWLGSDVDELKTQLKIQKVCSVNSEKPFRFLELESNM